jgi:ABC-2 type transport system permease protein
MPIFDQGYQHWKGSFSGHIWRWMAISRQGLSGQAKPTRSYVRVLLVAATMPALALVVVVACWGLLEQRSETVLQFAQTLLPPDVTADPHAYRHAVWTIAYSIFFRVELFLIMLLVVLVGPNLISRDLRFNALPLYFSRPITRLEYFLGKLGVIAALVAGVAVVPAIGAYVLGVCFSLDVSVIRDTWRLLPASIFYGLVIVVSAGMLMLALSSLSRRSLYVGIAWVGLWIVGSAVASILEGIERQSAFVTVQQEQMERARKEMSARPANAKAPRVQTSPYSYRTPDMWERAQEVLAKAAKTDWRPLCSYTQNLQRIGDGLLGTDAAWVEIGKAMEAPRAMAAPFMPGGRSTPVNTRRLADQLVLQYPWTWSAGVLAALLGISIWILSTRVKSLDRLK